MPPLKVNISPETLMPHSAPMVLIDKLIDAGEDFVHTQVEIRPGIPFFENSGVPSYVGLEYMAQNIAVWSGLQSQKQGNSPKIGFLVGSRILTLTIPQFSEGSVLDVFGHMIFHSDEMASFDCWIEHKGKRLTEARLNVFQPEDPNAIFLNLDKVQ